MNLYVMKNGERLGPLSLDEVRDRRARAEISDADLAWYEGLADWVTVAQIPGLSLGGGAIPIPPPAPVGGKDESLLTRRLLTVLVLGGVLTVILSFVFFFVGLVLGGAVSGAMASAQQHAQGYDQGAKIGREAGRQFFAHYGGMILGLSIVGALLVSAAISFGVAFSKLLPWCRRRSG